MTKLYAITTVKIHQGKLDEYVRLGKQAIEVTRARDTGTTHYEWFFNEDKSVCTVLEGYEDSNACLVHLGNVQETLMQLLQIADLSITVLGEMSPELKAATQALNPDVYPNYASSLADGKVEWVMGL